MALRVPGFGSLHGPDPLPEGSNSLEIKSAPQLSEAFVALISIVMIKED